MKDWRPLPDLELRLVRYFTVVAEHGNFGRAAANLHLSQPSLSRQIKRLEHQLGVRLLERSAQGTRLNTAGETFLPKAQALLHAADLAVRTARDAEPTWILNVGFVDDLSVSSAVAGVRDADPDAEVITRHLRASQADAALLGHEVDVLVARLPAPFSVDRLDVEELYEEPRVLAVAASHELASASAVTIQDFADEELVTCQVSGTVVWQAFWRLEPRANGRPAPTSPLTVDSFEDKLERVAAGDAIALLPAGDRRVLLHDDVVTVPIEGVDPCRVVVLTRQDDTAQLVDLFRSAARTHLRPRAVVPRGEEAVRGEGLADQRLLDPIPAP